MIITIVVWLILTKTKRTNNGAKDNTVNRRDTTWGGLGSGSLKVC